jgi:hypothetical protein
VRPKRPIDSFKKLISSNVPFHAPRTIMAIHKVPMEGRVVNAYSKKVCISKVIDYLAIKTIADKALL